MEIGGLRKRAPERKRLTSKLAWLALMAMLLACSSQAAHAPSPSPSPTAAQPSEVPSPSPTPPQQQELALPAPIEESAAAAANGRLYVMGGFNAAGASLDSVYVFDGGAWASGPRLPLPVDHPSAATVDGHVYIAGGHSNGADSARVFRLDGDRWSEVATLHSARGGHALIAYLGRLYAMGGNTNRGNVSAVESYDPTSNSWSVITLLPMPRNHVSGFVSGTSVCVAGGRSPTTSRVDCLNPVDGTWSRLPDLPKVTSGAGAVSFNGGRVVMMGGEDASERQVVDQLTYYSESSWTPATSMMVPRHGFELAVFNGRAWACGGGTSPGLHPVDVCTSVADRGQD